MHNEFQKPLSKAKLKAELNDNDNDNDNDNENEVYFQFANMYSCLVIFYYYGEIITCANWGTCVATGPRGHIIIYNN